MKLCRKVPREIGDQPLIEKNGNAIGSYGTDIL